MTASRPSPRARISPPPGGTPVRFRLVWFGPVWFGLSAVDCGLFAVGCRLKASRIPMVLIL
jgi:hypothetical protein